MGEAKRRKELGIYPEQTKKPPRKPKRQIEREIMNALLHSLPISHVPRRVR